MLTKTSFNELSILASEIQASQTKISALVSLIPIFVGQILASIIHFPGAYILERLLEGQTDKIHFDLQDFVAFGATTLLFPPYN